MEVYIEPVKQDPALYIVGAGHIAYQLASLAHNVGFRVHVIDDREKFANRERFPDAQEIVVDSIPDWLQRTALPSSSYAVIVTRGHRHDLDALRALVPRNIHYIGLIGSRAKIAKIFEVLDNEGIPSDQLQRVHAPIGLDIGAVTPQEIAVSIASELIAVKQGKMPEAADSSTPRSLRWTPKLVKAHR